MTEGNWPTWFPSETEAWHDFHDQLRNRGNVRSPLGVALEGYKRVKHPRELNEPWYVEPGRHEKPSKGFRDPYGESAESAGPRKTLDEWLDQEGLNVDRSRGLLRGIVEAKRRKAK